MLDQERMKSPVAPTWIGGEITDSSDRMLLAATHPNGPPLKRMLRAQVPSAGLVPPCAAYSMTQLVLIASKASVLEVATSSKLTSTPSAPAAWGVVVRDEPSTVAVTAISPMVVTA